MTANNSRDTSTGIVAPKTCELELASFVGVAVHPFSPNPSPMKPLIQAHDTNGSEVISEQVACSLHMSLSQSTGVHPVVTLPSW